MTHPTHTDISEALEASKTMTTAAANSAALEAKFTATRQAIADGVRKAQGKFPAPPVRLLHRSKSMGAW